MINPKWDSSTVFTKADSATMGGTAYQPPDDQTTGTLGSKDTFWDNDSQSEEEGDSDNENNAFQFDNMEEVTRNKEPVGNSDERREQKNGRTSESENEGDERATNNREENDAQMEDEEEAREDVTRNASKQQEQEEAKEVDNTVATEKDLMIQRLMEQVAALQAKMEDNTQSAEEQQRSNTTPETEVVDNDVQRRSQPPRASERSNNISAASHQEDDDGREGGAMAGIGREPG